MDQGALWPDDVELPVAAPEAPGQPPPHVSFSQVSTYSQCGEKYRLSYIENVPRESSGPAIAGTAIHETIARSEQEGWWDAPKQPYEPMVAAFIAAFEKLLDEAGDQVRWGGRKTRDFPEGENRDWWLFMGPIMLKRYAAVRKDDVERGITILPKDVERRVSAFMSVPGKSAKDSLLLMGYIDAIIMMLEDGSYVVRDWKTGSWAEPQQLAVYGWLLSQMVPPVTTTTGQIVKLRSPKKENWIHEYDLSPWIPLVPKLVTDAAIGIGNRYFPLKPSNLCPSCSVRKYCVWGSTLKD